MLDRVHRALRVVEDGLTLLAGGGVAVLAVLLVIDLVRRRFLHESLVWLYNFSGLYVFSAAIFLSLAHAHRMNVNIVLDVLVDRLPQPLRRVFAALGDLLGLLLFSMLAWVGFQVTSEAFTNDYTGDVALPWPLWTHYVLLPVGAGIAGLRALLKLLGVEDESGHPQSEPVPTEASIL